MLFQHPDYRARREEWELARDLYQAEYNVVCSDSRIFWPHAIEEVAGNQNAKDHFLRRSRRTRYLNLTEIVTSLIVSFLLRKEPDTSEVEQMLGDEIDNIDGKKNSLYSFIKNSFSVDYLLYGKAAILVDATKHNAKTKAEELALGVRPYFHSIHPLAVKDWDMSPMEAPGKYNWLRYEYTQTEPRQSETDQPKQRSYSKSYKQVGSQVAVTTYGGNIVEFGAVTDPDKQQWDVLGVDPLDVSRIPLIILEDVSWLKDVNQECLRYHNLRSSRDNILHNQGYQKIFLSAIDGADQQQVNALGETTWVFLPRDGTASTIEPPDLSSHERAIEESLNNIFKIGLNQLRLLPADSRVSQSAESINEEKENTYALVESTLTDIENAINQALSIYAEFKGQSGFDGEIELDKNISKDDVAQFGMVWNMFKDEFKKYGTLTKAAVTKAAKKLNLDPEDFTAAVAEIEAGPNVKQDTQQQANDPIAKQLGA